MGQPSRRGEGRSMKCKNKSLKRWPIEAVGIQMLCKSWETRCRFSSSSSWWSRTNCGQSRQSRKAHRDPRRSRFRFRGVEGRDPSLILLKSRRLTIYDELIEVVENRHHDLVDEFSKV
ncbi:hypothetical protein MPTK1_7g18990 [Marchantia polymorpha subsp. ruderalis]|uniref:Uncharacterized protein n=2 Tax=Marchantia polymorpha TaxID=3197 RepID=A0AAF6C1A0_MARPO|nr:hypothetical protein MARPO_0067s0079 [Marchantia polymorpha]BBN18034.1 hypothetical protein Mp_7g18990 [Marchantia polymorpha subsp. ruderalis]|eukprot:PTQ36002.1 hypothetical protein MARPO_0067s0079 [Marchantia polymorpha]